MHLSHYKRQKTLTRLNKTPWRTRFKSCRYTQSLLYQSEGVYREDREDSSPQIFRHQDRFGDRVTLLLPEIGYWYTGHRICWYSVSLAANGSRDHPSNPRVIPEARWSHAHGINVVFTAAPVPTDHTGPLPGLCQGRVRSEAIPETVYTLQALLHSRWELSSPYHNVTLLPKNKVLQCGARACWLMVLGLRSIPIYASFCKRLTGDAPNLVRELATLKNALWKNLKPISGFWNRLIPGGGLDQNFKTIKECLSNQKLLNWFFC